MALKFRWNGSVPGFSWVGLLVRKLTAMEVDENFGTLQAEYLELRAMIEAGIAIMDITVDDPISPTMFTITLEDYRTFNLPLPVAAFNPREIPWSNNLTLSRLDIFDVPGLGQYWTRVTHTTPAPPAVFDPEAEDGEGNRLYAVFSNFDAMMHFREEGYVMGEDYAVNDVFVHPSYGTFFVLVDHEAEAESEDFDPSAVDDDDNPLYYQIAAPVNMPTRTVSEAFYTVALRDVGWYLRFDSPTGCAIQIPADVDFPAGGMVQVRQASSGPLTFSEEVGFTINPQRRGYDSSTSYDGATVAIVFVSATEADLVGPHGAILES